MNHVHVEELASLQAAIEHLRVQVVGTATIWATACQRVQELCAYINAVVDTIMSMVNTMSL